MRFHLDKESVELLQAERAKRINFKGGKGQYPSRYYPLLSLTSVYFHFLVSAFWDSHMVSFSISDMFIMLFKGKRHAS